jgi:hypothetical protein
MVKIIVLSDLYFQIFKFEPPDRSFVRFSKNSSLPSLQHGVWSSATSGAPFISPLYLRSPMETEGEREENQVNESGISVMTFSKTGSVRNPT